MASGCYGYGYSYMEHKVNFLKKKKKKGGKEEKGRKPRWNHNYSVKGMVWIRSNYMA